MIQDTVLYEETMIDHIEKAELNEQIRKLMEFYELCPIEQVGLLTIIINDISQDLRESS